MTSRIRLTLLSILAAAVGLPGLASAADVDLHGATAFVSGLSKLKVKDLGTCSNDASMNVEFRLTKDKWKGIDADERLYKGGYKQTGTDGRKLVASLTSKSRKTLKRAVKSLVKFCFETNDVSVDLSNIVVIGKVNDTFDQLLVKVKAHVDGKVDGDSGSAEYILKMVGPLTLAAPM